MRLGLRNALDDRQSLVEQDPLVLIDDVVHLRLYAVPDLVEAFLSHNQLVAEPFEVTLYAELVVGAGISKVETGRNSEIGFEDERKLGNDSLPAWAGVGDQKTRLGRIKDSLGGVDEFADLESRSPHGALATGDGSVSIAIVEHFVWYESTP